MECYLEPLYSKSATAISIKKLRKKYSEEWDTFRVSISTLFVSFSVGSKFFPLRVDPAESKSYLIQRNKQELMQVKVSLFPKKEVGGWGGVCAFIRAGAFNRITLI